MKWRKLGKIFQPDGDTPWMKSHAAVPVAQHLHADVFRIYVSCRDAAQRSYPAWFDIDLRRPSQILQVSEKPLLPLGSPGTFDDSGVMPCWITAHPDGDRFYYIGWNRGVSVPFRNSLGLACRQPDGSVTKYSDGPVLDRSPHDPCFVASACVLKEDALWKMWYLSCLEWISFGDSFQHRYHIKYATSADGATWERDGTVCIDFCSPVEYAISRPCVIRDEDCYRMWYAYRGETYRIGYAESADGVTWNRMDGAVGIDVSKDGWDSQMIEYPYVFDHSGTRYMLYNGNGYGKSGIGLAVLERD